MSKLNSLLISSYPQAKKIKKYQLNVEAQNALMKKISIHRFTLQKNNSLLKQKLLNGILNIHQSYNLAFEDSDIIGKIFRGIFSK